MRPNRPGSAHKPRQIGKEFFWPERPSFPRGRFICLNFGIDEEGRYLGHTGGQSMFDNFTIHWRALRDDGQISEDEFSRATFAQHYRTVDEFTAPFRKPQSAVCQAGLKLVSLKHA